MYTRHAYHLATKEFLADVKVSDHSHWRDTVWFFTNPTAGQRKGESTIRWDFQMPDGSSFADDEWTALRDAFKRLVWSLFNDPYHGKHYKPAMLSALHKGVSYFARWMAAAGYANFGELDPVAFDEFVDHLMADKGVRDDADGEITASYLTKYLGLPTLLAGQAPVLAKAGIPVPACLPWGGQSALGKAKELAAHIRGTIPPIPDDIFLKVLAAALAILDDAGNLTKKVELFGANRADLSTAAGYALSARLRTQANDVLDACLILVQGLTGMRVSEICGLTISSDSGDGWPSCISVRPSASGLHEMFYIQGRLFKTVQSFIDTEWIAGSRPVGTDHIPIPVRAMCAVDRLFRSRRNAAGAAALFVGFTSPSGLSDTVAPLSAVSVNRCQKRAFARLEMDDWTVSSHQWRKTFAQYVIRSDNRMLPVLRDHFKHLSIAMTEEGYINADPELKQLIDDAAVQQTVRVVGDLIDGKSRAYGPLADVLTERAASLGIRLGNRGADDRAEDIEDLVRSSGMRVWEVGAGKAATCNCLYRQGTGKCTEGVGARWVLRNPLWSAARPDLCWECENLIVDDSHSQFWLERAASLRAQLVDAEQTRDEAFAMLCKQRISQCGVVLDRMGIKMEPENAA